MVIPLFYRFFLLIPNDGSPVILQVPFWFTQLGGKYLLRRMSQSWGDCPSANARVAIVRFPTLSNAHPVSKPLQKFARSWSGQAAALTRGPERFGLICSDHEGCPSANAFSKHVSQLFAFLPFQTPTLIGYQPVSKPLEKFAWSWSSQAAAFIFRIPER